MANAPAELHDKDVYFVPHGSRWPIFASVGLFIMMVGAALWLNQAAAGGTQHVRCMDLSLLRGADIVLQSGNTGYVFSTTVTGGGRVRWA